VVQLEYNVMPTWMLVSRWRWRWRWCACGSDNERM